MGLKLCLEADLLPKGFSVELTVNGKKMFKKEVTAGDLPPVCMSKVPGLDKVTNLCLVLSKVNLVKRSACVKITFKVKVGPVKKTVKISLGCFTIPKAGEASSNLYYVPHRAIEDSNPPTSFFDQQAVERVSMEGGDYVDEFVGDKEHTRNDMEMTADKLTALLKEILSETGHEIDLDLNITSKGNVCV